MTKLKVALICGGRSTEHSISLKSTRGILGQINSSKYDLSLIKIDIDGSWWLLPALDVDTPEKGSPVTLIAGKAGAKVLNTNTGTIEQEIDLAFPILHGIFGEDGTIQGLFKMFNVAFVGCGVTASGICMDKDVTKRLLRDAGIGIAPYLCATQNNRYSFAEAAKVLDTNTLFLKPASLGSSVGIHKVTNQQEYEIGLKDGLEYDTKVIIEPNIIGREIECAVLGNEAPQASYPGEIVMDGDAFYDFESKYISKEAAKLHIPAKLSEEQIEKMRNMACKAFATCGCEGLARVDFFVKEDGDIIINEINTLPGFTEISMYPKMWVATGMKYSELLDKLIDLGIERYHREQQLKIISRPA